MYRTIFLILFIISFINAFAFNNEELEYQVRIWNEIHNTKKTEDFKALYASKVLFYGRSYSGQKCYQQKAKFLTSDYQQFIISKITITEYSSGTIMASFRKKVLTKKKSKEYDCYLLFRKSGSNYLITGESDRETDKNLKVQLDLGTEISNSGLPKALISLIVLGLGIGGIFVWKNNSRKRQYRSRYRAQAFTSSKPVNHTRSYSYPNRKVDENIIAEKVTAAVMAKFSNVLVPGDVANNKGIEFEKYVVERFEPEYFRLKEWRSDKYHEGIYADSNRLPDLEYLYTDSRNQIEFAVECKWRAKTDNGKLEWAKDYQFKTYKEYARERNITVFVIIGVGGQPSNPENLYIVPLRKVSTPVLSVWQLNKFRKFGKGNFFLQTSTKELT